MKNAAFITNIPLSQKVLVVIMTLFACVFFTTVIGNHYYFRTYAYDYAVYNFAFWDYAHFHASPVPLYHALIPYDATFLHDHFSLTFIFFVPLYWLFNWLTGSYTLLVIQVGLILWSGWAIYKLIKLKTSDDWLGVLAVLYYFLFQGRYSSFAADANILALICCFIPIFLLCFELKKYVQAASIFIFLLFSREDMPLWFIFIFIILGIWHWKEKRIVWFCISGMIISIAYFITLFKVFIPLCEPPGHHYFLFQYSALGNTPGEALLHIIEHPFEALKLLYFNQTLDPMFDGIKKEFYLVYLISGGFVLFFRPQYFIWFIPLIAQKMFNDDPSRWGIRGYYSIPVITILPISIFIIVSKLKFKWAKYSLAIIVCLLTFSVTYYKMNINHRVLLWGNTTKENIFDPMFFHPGFNASEVHKALSLIPADAKVCASSSLLPHLSQRKYVYEFPDVKDAEYLTLFTFPDFFGVTEDTYYKDIVNCIINPSWVTIAHTPLFILMKKADGASKNRNTVDSIECGAEAITTNSIHYIASSVELSDSATNRDSSLSHSGKYSIRLNRKNSYGFVYHGERYKPGDLLKITVWKYPASKDTGNLVVSCGKSFYRAVSEGDIKEISGWTQLRIYLTVPEDNSDFKIYVWNDLPKSVWFDDLKIVRYSIK